MKYTVEYRQQLAEEYLSGRIGLERLAAREGLDYSNLRRWVAAFREHGVAGLERKYAKYDVTFKLKVLRRMRDENLSTRAAAALFNIRTTQTISEWKRLYAAGGVSALSRTRWRGHSNTSKMTAAEERIEGAANSRPATLRRDNEELRAEIAYLKLAGSLSLRGQTLDAPAKARIVQELRATHPVGFLLTAAGLPRSTFYYQIKALSKSDPDACLKNQLKDIYNRHKGLYGYRRITATFRQAGLSINHKRVQRLMSALNLKAIIRQRKYVAFRGPVSRIAPNHLNRDFSSPKPNEKWVTDVTEFKVDGKKLYLSSVLDLYNGEIVAFHTSVRPNFELVSYTMDKAVKRLRPGDRPLIHSDQGWQYQMAEYRSLLSGRGLTQSMSRRGNCYDNAVMESFFGTLKSECFHLRRFRSVDHLDAGLANYIRYYNNERIKLKLGGLSPVQFRVKNHAVRETQPPLGASKRQRSVAAATTRP